MAAEDAPALPQDFRPTLGATAGSAWSGHRSLLLALVVLALQLVLAIECFDSDGVRNNPEEWARIPHHRGSAFRMSLLYICLLAFFLYPRAPQHFRQFKSAIAGYSRVRPLCFQCCAYGIAFGLAIPVFTSPFPLDGWQWPWALMWVAATLVALVLTAWVIAPAAYWKAFARRERRALLYTAAILLAYILVLRDWLKLGEEGLWSGALAQLTLHASVAVLEIFYPSVLLIADQAIMGAGDFKVHISAECSGMEGAALLVALVGAYLYTFRTELRFPAAFALLAFAVPLSLSLNVARIAILVAIGAEISPEWAIKGFHIYGGLVFLLLECVALWALSRTSWFSRPREQTGFVLDFEAALLIPLLTLLAATLLTGLLTVDFDWLYPLRAIAVGAAIAICFKPLRSLLTPPRWLPVLAGLAVLPLWLLLVPAAEDTDRADASALASVPPTWAAAWLCFRVLGAVVTVPIAEELAFRGYLLKLLTRRQPAEGLPLPFDWIALAGSSLLFGALHGHWVAGTLAGMVYGLVRYRSGRIGDAVIAHATTNAALALYVLSTGRWSYW